MIIVYPMLVSNNVQSNVLPGISKVLEKYTLTYRMDDIITEVNAIAKGKCRKIGSILKLTESNINEQGTKIPPGAIPVVTTGGSRGPREGEVGEVKVETPSFGSLSLEPTWIKIDTYFGTRLIGIKVVPFPISSDSNLIDAITADRNLKLLPAMLRTVGRKVLRGIWAAIRWTHLPFTQLSISGDPKKDVILARTVHRDQLFVAMNFMDIGSGFFEKTKSIKWLHRLGWSSFVIADDVNKRAYFCMKEFNGLCSSVQYNFMYTSIGKEHGKVWSDLEDVKKSSSPFFKLSTKAQEIVGEQYASHQMSKYMIG